MVKKCKICGLLKPVGEFNKCAVNTSTGLSTYCRLCQKVYRATYHRTNASHEIQAHREYYQQFGDIARASSSSWKNSHKDEVRAYNREYHHRRKQDPIYRIRKILRGRFKAALKGNYKRGSAIELLGCSIAEFKQHLELKWQPGMTWNNYGRWEIDHIIPLVSFDLTDAMQLKKVCHYTNLQPLWKTDHLLKTISEIKGAKP